MPQFSKGSRQSAIGNLALLHPVISLDTIKREYLRNDYNEDSPVLFLSPSKYRLRLETQFVSTVLCLRQAAGLYTYPISTPTPVIRQCRSKRASLRSGSPPKLPLRREQGVCALFSVGASNANTFPNIEFRLVSQSSRK